MSTDRLEVEVAVKFKANNQATLVGFVRWFVENSSLICSLYEDENDLDDASISLESVLHNAKQPD